MINYLYNSKLKTNNQISDIEYPRIRLIISSILLSLFFVSSVFLVEYYKNHSLSIKENLAIEFSHESENAEKLLEKEDFQCFEISLSNNLTSNNDFSSDFSLLNSNKEKVTLSAGFGLGVFTPPDFVV